MMIWKEQKDSLGNYYMASKGSTHFFIEKRGYRWYTDVWQGKKRFNSWQVTKTLKAAKAACEDYAHYNL